MACQFEFSCLVNTFWESHAGRIDNINASLRVFGVDGAATRELEIRKGLPHSGIAPTLSALRPEKGAFLR